MTVGVCYLLSTSVDFIVYLGSLMLEQATWHCSSVYGNLGVYLFYFRRPAVQVLMCGCDRSRLACSNKSSSHTPQYALPSYQDFTFMFCCLHTIYFRLQVMFLSIGTVLLLDPNVSKKLGACLLNGVSMQF